MADGAARAIRPTLADTLMADVDKILYEAIFNGFYGEITLQFKAGKVILIRRNETLLPGADATVHE
jgi:hypothetical protein